MELWLKRPSLLDTSIIIQLKHIRYKYNNYFRKYLKSSLHKPSTSALSPSRTAAALVTNTPGLELLPALKSICLGTCGCIGCWFTSCGVFWTTGNFWSWGAFWSWNCAALGLSTALLLRCAASLLTINTPLPNFSFGTSTSAWTPFAVRYQRQYPHVHVLKQSAMIAIPSKVRSLQALLGAHPFRLLFLATTIFREASLHSLACFLVSTRCFSPAYILAVLVSLASVATVTMPCVAIIILKKRRKGK